MRYIDTIHHQTVGLFVGHPVHHPRCYRYQWRSGTADFGATPHNLVVGDGAGGHPGLVVHGFEGLVALFLLNGVDNYHLDIARALRPAQTAAAVDRLESQLLAAVPRSLHDPFEYCGWGLEQFAKFLQDCQDPTKAATPFNPQRDPSTEHWLACSFGEYCWHHQPELAEKFIRNLKTEFPEAVTEVSSPVFRNVVRAGQSSAVA